MVDFRIASNDKGIAQVINNLSNPVSMLKQQARYRAALRLDSSISNSISCNRSFA